MRIYEATDDYGSMEHAAVLMARALRHDLYGPSLLLGSDLPTTTHRVLFASAFPPPDGRTLTDQAARKMRLGLAIVKKYGWQRRDFGGDGTMEEFLQASFMILSASIAPPKRVWEGDLKSFFTNGPFMLPTPDEPALATSAPEKQALEDLLRQAETVRKEAEAGDPASQGPASRDRRGCER